MKAVIYTILAFALILFIAYRGLLNKAPNNFIFINNTSDTIDVRIEFKDKFYYVGTGENNTNGQYASLKIVNNGAVVLSGKKEILYPGIHTFYVHPRQKILLGRGDLDGFTNVSSMSVKYNDSTYYFSFSSIKKGLVKKDNQYIFSFI